MEITKQYFDDAIQGISLKFTAELKDTEERIITRIDESQAELARMVKRGLDDITARLDVRENVEKLEKQMREVRQELNLA